MKITIIIQFACIFILFISCKENTADKEKNSSKPTSIVDYSSKNVRMMDSLKKKSLSKGDTSAFKMLYMYFEEDNRDSEILTISLIMAQKYNYNFAFFCVYNILINQEFINDENLDEQTNNLALYYLSRSYELGYLDAIDAYKLRYNNNENLHNSSYYLQRMISYNNKIFKIY